MNIKLREEIDRIWNTVQVRDEGMGVEYAVEIPIEQFYEICEHFYNLGYNKNTILD